MDPNLPMILVKKSSRDRDFDHDQGSLPLLKENELKKCSKLVEGYYKKVLAIHKVESIGFLSITQFPPFFFFPFHNVVIKFHCHCLAKSFWNYYYPKKYQMYQGGT
jgi:hypothetical protein